MNAERFLIATSDVVVGRREALLRGVTMTVRPAECWFLLGRNGVGKSTLIATLLGLLQPLDGSITLAPTIASGDGIGFVPQEQRFQQSLPVTVAEFVELGIRERGRAQRADRAAAALIAMRIPHLAARDASALSLGQRRRVLVARALARRPGLLVLDEPTANLDPFGAGQLGADLETLRANDGLSLLHASHDIDLARRYATHIAFAAGGTVRTGDATLLDAPEVTAELGLGGR